MKLLFTISATFLCFISFSEDNLKTIKIDKKVYHIFPFILTEEPATYEYLNYELKSTADTIADLLFYSKFLKTPSINIVMYFNDKKSIAYKGQFVFGKENGLCETFHKNGNTYYKYYMKDGKMNGKRIIYYKENEDSMYTLDERYFLDDVTIGEAKTYLENGIILEKSFYKNGCPDSTFSKFYKTGEIEELWNYSNCQLNGEQLKFYTNGNIQTKSYWNNGTVDSTWTEYFENGIVHIIYNYKNSERKSKTQFYPSGIKKSEGNYSSSHFRTCMALVSEDDIHYKTGDWKYWNESGKLIKVETYSENKLVNFIEY